MWSEKEVVDQAAWEFEEVGHSPPIHAVVSYLCLLYTVLKFSFN